MISKNSKAQEGGRRGESIYDVIIVGGGIAGLSSAYFLQNYNILLLEKEDYVGGRALSGSYKGYTYAKGTEYLGELNGALKRIVDELELPLKEIPSPMDAHFDRGKFYYGEDGLALRYIKNSSIKEYNHFINTVLDLAREYQEIPYLDLDSNMARLDQMTARQWFKQNNFSLIYENSYNVTSRGLFGANLDEISALSYIPEIAFDFDDNNLVSNINDLANSHEQNDKPTSSYTFIKGISELCKKMGEYLKDDIRLQTLVLKVNRKKDHYVVSYQDRYKKINHVASPIVILAVPSPVAVKLASTILQREQKKIMVNIPYAPYITMALFSKEPIFNKAFDLAVSDDFFFTDIYSSTWVQRYYDSSLRNIYGADITGIYIAPHTYKDRSILNQSNKQLLSKVVKDLQRVFPHLSFTNIMGYDVQRFQYGYPVMIPGAYKRLKRLHEITNGGILLAGDYMIYPTFEAAADSGLLAAAKAQVELNRLNIKEKRNRGKGQIGSVCRDMEEYIEASLTMGPDIFRGEIAAPIYCFADLPHWTIKSNFLGESYEWDDKEAKATLGLDHEKGIWSYGINGGAYGRDKKDSFKISSVIEVFGGLVFSEDTRLSLYIDYDLEYSISSLGIEGETSIKLISLLNLDLFADFSIDGEGEEDIELAADLMWEALPNWFELQLGASALLVDGDEFYWGGTLKMSL